MSDEKPIGALLDALNLRKTAATVPAVVSPKARSAIAPIRRELPASPLQRELFADTSWFPVLRGLILSGATAQLGPYAIAAYIVMKAKADYRTGMLTNSSAPDVARACGMSERVARAAIQKLVDFGLLSAEPSPGRKTRYQLTERLPILDKDKHGSELAWMSFDFASKDFGELVKRAVIAAKAELAGFKQPISEASPSMVINIGGDVSLNVNVQVIQGAKSED